MFLLGCFGNMLSVASLPRKILYILRYFWVSSFFASQVPDTDGCDSDSWVKCPRLQPATNCDCERAGVCDSWAILLLLCLEKWRCLERSQSGKYCSPHEEKVVAVWSCGEKERQIYMKIRGGGRMVPKLRLNDTVRNDLKEDEEKMVRWHEGDYKTQYPP